MEEGAPTFPDGVDSRSGEAKSLPGTKGIPESVRRRIELGSKPHEAVREYWKQFTFHECATLVVAKRRLKIHGWKRRKTYRSPQVRRWTPSCTSISRGNVPYI